MTGRLVRATVAATFDVDAAALAATLADQAGLAVTGPFEVLDGGQVNLTVAVDTDHGPQVVRLLGEPGRAALAIELMARLAGAGAAVARPRRLRRDRLVGDHAGRRFCVLERLAGGPPPRTPAGFRRVGRAVAELQQHLARVSVVVARADRFTALIARRSRVLARLRARPDAAAAALGGTRRELDELLAGVAAADVSALAGGEHVTLHTDLYGGNLRDDGRRIAAFDFDDAGVGGPLVDALAYPAWEAVDDGAPAVAQPALLAAYLAGYREVAALPGPRLAAPAAVDALVFLNLAENVHHLVRAAARPGGARYRHHAANLRRARAWRTAAAEVAALLAEAA